MRRRLLVLLVEDVDVPLGVGRSAVAEGGVEAQVVALADGGDGIVVFLRQLHLLEVGDNAVCDVLVNTGAQGALVINAHPSGQTWG